jgi:hypothetical protein
LLLCRLPEYPRRTVAGAAYLKFLHYKRQILFRNFK